MYGHRGPASDACVRKRGGGIRCTATAGLPQVLCLLLQPVFFLFVCVCARARACVGEAGCTAGGGVGCACALFVLFVLFVLVVLFVLFVLFVWRSRRVWARPLVLAVPSR